MLRDERSHIRGSHGTAHPVVAVLLALTFTLTTGCQTLPHHESKEQAAGRWNQVRGRFKYQLARQKYDGGLFGEAVVTAMEAIALDPKEVGAYVVLARANLELGKPATASSAIRAARSAGLTSAALTYTEGVVLEQKGDLNGALEAYRTARRVDTREVDYIVAEAECLAALGRPEEAQTLLDGNRKRYDDDATVVVLAAHVAARRGDVDGAVARYREALIDHRDSEVVPRELGLLLTRQRRFTEAIATLRPILQLGASGSDDGIVRRALASCYLESGAPESARDVLMAYGREHPDDALGQLLLAKACLATGDLMSATRAVDLAQRQEPNRPELWLVRATVQWRRGDYAGAMASLYDVLANDPEDVEALCLLGEVLKDRRQETGARSYFKRALDVNPRCAWARAALASLNKPRTPLPPESDGAKLTAAD